jgi:predicted RNA-binding protein with PIN domain
MLYLVDGYNVTMRDPATSGRSKEGQREELLARLRVHGQRLAPGGAVVVVFDAHSALGRSSGEGGSVKAVFASVADDEIVRRCGGAVGRVVVVTDDLRLRARISQDVGRHVEYRDGSSVFAETLTAASHASRRAPIARDTGLPPGANKITEELKDLWLTEDE